MLFEDNGIGHDHKYATINSIERVLERGDVFDQLVYLFSLKCQRFYDLDYIKE
jgi:hypothetical protein